MASSSLFCVSSALNRSRRSLPGQATFEHHAEAPCGLPLAGSLATFLHFMQPIQTDRQTILRGATVPMCYGWTHVIMARVLRLMLSRKGASCVPGAESTSSSGSVPSRSVPNPATQQIPGCSWLITITG